MNLTQVFQGKSQVLEGDYKSSFDLRQPPVKSHICQLKSRVNRDESETNLLKQVSLYGVSVKCS